MPIWDNWSSNPAENNGAPPFGAGEKRLTFDLITDTFRVVMAAIKELAASTVDKLGSMAFQDKNNIDVTGGNIGGTCKMNASNLNTGQVPLDRLPSQLTGKNADGLTALARQTLYDQTFPVGTPRLWHNTTGVGLTWPGVTATWTRITAAENYVLVVAGSQTGVLQGAGTQTVGTNILTDVDGNHNHGGSVSGALNASHLPADQLRAVSFDTSSGATPGGGTRGLVQTLNPGGGQPHFHPVATDGAHDHAVPFDPLRFGVVLYIRTA